MTPNRVESGEIFQTAFLFFYFVPQCYHWSQKPNSIVKIRSVIAVFCVFVFVDEHDEFDVVDSLNLPIKFDENGSVEDEIYKVLSL